MRERWEGSYTSSRMCCVPYDQSRGVQGLRRARDPFSLFSTKLIMQDEAVLVPPGFKPLSGCPLLLGRTAWSCTWLSGPASMANLAVHCLLPDMKLWPQGALNHSSNAQLLPTPELPLCLEHFSLYGQKTASSFFSAQLQCRSFRKATCHPRSKPGPRQSLPRQHALFLPSIYRNDLLSVFHCPWKRDEVGPVSFLLSRLLNTCMRSRGCFRKDKQFTRHIWVWAQFLKAWAVDLAP